MSRKELKEAVAWIGKDMSSPGKKPSGSALDPKARSEMNARQGQIFIINEEEYIGEILPLYEVTTNYKEWIKIQKNKAVISTIFTQIRTFMNNRKVMAPTGTYAISKEEQAEFLAQAAVQAKKYEREGDHVYVVPAFESAKGAKYKGAKGGKQSNNISIITATNLNAHFRKTVAAGVISGKHQLGHGDKGISVAEYNVVSRQQLAAEKFGLTKQEIKQLDTIYIESKKEHLDKINIEHGQEVTEKGKIKKTHSLVLTMQAKWSNKADRDKEAAFVGSCRKKAIELAEQPGSTRLVDAINRTLMWKFKPRPGMRVIGLRKAKIKESGKADHKFNSGYKSVQQFAVTKGIAINKSKFKSTQPKAGKPTSSLQNILGLINTRLPSKIQKNMGSPSLNNVTGRFSSSIEALKIRQTGRNRLPTLQYTYDKDPYQVFETGAKGDRRWATTARDPRLLIDKSIREVAKELALGKFTTQRI